MELDLHGLNVEEATIQILTTLFSFDNDEFSYELTVITGHGTSAMKITLLNIIDEESYKYSYNEINNGGAFIIRKRN